MAAHKRERKQAAIKGGELGFTLVRVSVALVFRWYGFPLSSFYVVPVLRWGVGMGLRVYG